MTALQHFLLLLRMPLSSVVTKSQANKSQANICGVQSCPLQGLCTISFFGSVGEKAVKEGRCEGLSGRFMAVKVGGKCDKHGKHGDKDADKHSKHTDKDAEQQPQDDFHPDGPLPEEPRPDMPGARRSLAGHHDKKHHGGKHGDHKGHHEHLDVADMTFEDVQGTV